MGKRCLKKIGIICLKEDVESVLDILQDTGVLHITSKESVPEQVSSHQLNQIKRTLNTLQPVIEGLKKFDKTSKGFSNMVPSRFVVDKNLVDKTIKGFRWQDICSDYESFITSLKNIDSHLHRIELEIERLREWTPLKIAFERIKPTRYTNTILGSVPTKRYHIFLKELEDVRFIYSKTITETRFERKVLISYHKDIEKKLRDLLKRFEFVEFREERFMGTPSEIISELEDSKKELLKEKEILIKELSRLTVYILQLSIVYDYYNSLLAKIEKHKELLPTRYTILIQGWIENDKLSLLEDKLQGFNICIEEILPSQDEEPPVLLKNPEPVKPFEVITKLYGLPKRYELDPTPMLLPFFAISFAICLTDAGYGLLLTLLSVYFLKKFTPLGESKKLLTLLAILGGTTVIIGILTGGIFGIDFSGEWKHLVWFKKLRDTLLLFDPLKQPSLLFIIALAIGFAQVYTGIVLRAYQKWINGYHKDAILDDIPWILLLAGIAIGIIGSVSKIAPLQQTAKILSLTGAILILLLGGRRAKTIIGKFFQGLYALYGVVGILADVLSYSRLLALGLATSVLASVVNTLAGVLKGIPFIGPIVMILILVLGHIFTLLINSLGGFVHCLRLQFVEFFTKFYEGGAEPFTPFARKSKYTILKE